MAWKMDADKLAVNESGNPIWIFSDGAEEYVDYGAVRLKINELNEQKKKGAEAKKSLEKIMETLGIEDSEVENFVKTAKQNAELVKDGMAQADKKLQEAFELEKAKVTKLESVIKEKDDVISAKEQLLNKQTISSAFAKSKYVTDECVSVNIIERLFADSAKIEDNKIVFYQDGEKILNDKGEVDFDYALKKLVCNSPDNSVLLKSKGAGGSGSGNAASAGGADFANMTIGQLNDYCLKNNLDAEAMYSTWSKAQQAKVKK